jgi:hypothetical protein
MHKKAVLLCVLTLYVAIFLAGCLASRPYTFVKPYNGSTNMTSEHGIDLSILNITPALKNNSGPGIITFEVAVTNVDLRDYTIRGDSFQLITNNTANNSTILLPTSTQNSCNNFLTYNHTNPRERVTGNVTFYVPQNERLSVLRYVDMNLSIGILF